MVKFLGWLPKPSLADYYSQAHFLLLPTNASEGWPKVLSEAMAYGVVPLAGAVSSIPQILQETGAGLALPPEDPEAFVQAIQNFLAEPRTMETGKHGRGRCCTAILLFPISGFRQKYLYACLAIVFTG